MVVFVSPCQGIALPFAQRKFAVPLTHLHLHEAPLTFVDVETTGLRPELGHRVVEIALLRTQGLETVDTFVSLLNPQRPIDPGAARVNGITDFMVADAPTFDQILPDLLPFLQETILVAHNAPFDMGFLQAEFRRAGEPFTPGPILDTLMLARRQYYFASNSLGNIARRLGIHTPHAHRALGDVQTTFAIFRRFTADLIRRGQVRVADWIRAQGGTAWRPPPVAAGLPAGHPLRIALERKCDVQITYRAASGRCTERVVTPLDCAGGYLIGHCHLRGEQRTFRLDRIETITLIEP
ncbi:MAG: WYL domain-containing protein [Caldilineae bacterium]|nr:MAG: WYL domain-containing protein [Caldilineae bacterium]